MKNFKSDRGLVASFLIILGVAARLIPHPANVSPMNSISLFGGAKLSRAKAFALTFAMLIASDLLLGRLEGHQAFGYWSLFTYTGFAAIILAGQKLHRSGALKTAGFITASSTGFWLWTNFGLWLTGDHGLYARNAEGLVACYANALPFLANSLSGDLAWGAAFFLAFQGARQLAPKLGFAVQGA